MRCAAVSHVLTLLLHALQLTAWWRGMFGFELLACDTRQMAQSAARSLRLVYSSLVVLDDACSARPSLAP